MIQFSARGDLFLLAPKREGAYLEQGAIISFLRNNQMLSFF